MLAAAVAAAWALGLLRPERVLATDAQTLFFAGGFAVVVGTLAFRFWRLHEPSAHYFRFSTQLRAWESEAHFLGGGRRRIALGRNRGEAFDLPARAQLALCIALALLLALACLDARSLGLMGRFERGVAAANSSFCPEAEAAAEQRDANTPGCALIRRAFELGYAKDLGDCGAKARRAATVCTLRQRDEPFLHYAWRLFEGAWSKVSRGAAPDTLRALVGDFEGRLTRLSGLNAARRQLLTSAPHASHHIWTNLPEPKEGAFQTESCADRYRNLPHRPPPGAVEGRASRVFEHTLAELLFESSYEPAAGSCREYHVHWGAPEDACARLVKAPEAFLEQWGALADVRATLDRQRMVSDRDAHAEQASQRQLPPTAFVSFQCYVESSAPGRTSRPFQVGATAFSAEELRAAPSARDATLFVDRYALVASLLTSGFHYGSLMSEAGLEQEGAEQSLEPAFTGKDFLLSRLYGLANVDIYLGPGWVAQRPDLLEVYPYELHLKNYVRVFRRQYLRERGRL